MNIKSATAFILASFVLGYGVFSSGDPLTFLNLHAFLIVIGGTVAAGAISFRVDRMLLLFRVFFRQLLKRDRKEYAELIRELMQMAEARRSDPSRFEELVASCQDHFLKEAMTAMLDEILDEESLIRVLRARASTIFRGQWEEVIQFKTVGKFPPAFGLLGTTLSMITLLHKLGAPGGQKLLGPAMAIGLVATFYGLVLANFVFVPIAENLADGARANRVRNMVIVEAVRLILKRTNALVLAEELNSFLQPKERIDWKAAKGGGASRGRAEAA